jgi:PmbA protein
MLDSAAQEALAQRVVALSPAAQTEVTVSGEDFGLTRFARNAIVQNVGRRTTTVRVRAVVEGRVGIALTNDLADAGLRAAVERACALARLAPRDDAFPGLGTAPRTPQPPGAFRASTAAAAPELRARLAADVFAVAERDGLWCAGYAKTSHEALTVANSCGTLTTFEGTGAALNVKQNAADASGYAERYSNDVADLDAARVAGIAAEKALASRAPVAVEPGPWTVILEPAAFGELLSYLTAHFSAQAYDEGSSFLSAGLGARYADEGVTIVDDHAHPLAVGMPFDFEGTPTARVTLLDAGIGAGIVTDRYWAHELARPNTGHAVAVSETETDGPQPRSLVVMPGGKSTAQLIAETERGLLVSRLWYVRNVDQRRTIVTGMTRDGTFLIEAGKLTRGVANMRFNQSILAALRRPELSAELSRTARYTYAMVVPAAKIEGFRFTSGTAF